MIAKLLEYYGADLSRVSEYGWRSMRCPFHDDRHASARVSLELNAFVCLGCGVKGDAIKLVMENENLGYANAVDFIERVSGEKVEGVRRSAKSGARDPKPSRWRTTLFE